MAVLAVGGELKQMLKVLSAAAATVLAMPGALAGQAQRTSSDWLQVTPADPRAPIPRDTRMEVYRGAAMASTGLRTRALSRRDSVAAVRAYAAARKDKDLRIIVSLDERQLWVVTGADTVMTAPVAVGSGERLIFGEKAWTFETPRGVRVVRGKDDNPLWTPPVWHYAETATEYGLRVHHLSLTTPYQISGGRKLMFRGGEAGVMHPDSGFMLLPLDEEIVFDGTLFVPPVGSKNRQIQGTLGKYKLDTGGGILLHGTPHKSTIGSAATHGCLRLRDEDIEWLYDYIPVGTKVYIY